MEQFFLIQEPPPQKKGNMIITHRFDFTGGAYPTKLRFNTHTHTLDTHATGDHCAVTES